MFVPNINTVRLKAKESEKYDSQFGLRQMYRLIEFRTNCIRHYVDVFERRINDRLRFGFPFSGSLSYEECYLFYRMQPGPTVDPCYEEVWQTMNTIVDTIAISYRNGNYNVAIDYQRKRIRRHYDKITINISF